MQLGSIRRPSSRDGGDSGGKLVVFGVGVDTYARAIPECFHRAAVFGDLLCMPWR